MKVAHNMKNLNLDESKEIYCCATCDKLFNWDENSYWYGSYREMEENSEKNPVPYYCSKKCYKTNLINP